MNLYLFANFIKASVEVQQTTSFGAVLRAEAVVDQDVLDLSYPDFVVKDVEDVFFAADEDSFGVVEKWDVEVVLLEQGVDGQSSVAEAFEVGVGRLAEESGVDQVADVVVDQAVDGVVWEVGVDFGVDRVVGDVYGVFDSVVDVFAGTGTGIAVDVVEEKRVLAVVKLFKGL